MRILIADDNPVFRHTLKSVLRTWGHDAIVTGTGNEAWEMLRTDSFLSLAVLDVKMPDLDGIEICKRVRAMRSISAPYLILLTANNQTEQVVAGLKAGANDYITKPVNAGELHARLDAGIRVVTSQRILVSRVHSLENLSLTDELTGLWNRRGFLFHAEQHLKRSLRTRATSLLVYADMDYLKQINDNFGHHEGSLAIEAAADILRKTFRESDVIARLGGDEFAILAIDAGSKDIEEFTTRLLENIHEYKPLNSNVVEFRRRNCGANRRE